MNEDALTQVTNGPDMDLDMYGDLQNADPGVVGHPEPNVSSRDKVRGINESCAEAHAVVRQLLSNSDKGEFTNVRLGHP